MVDDGFCSESCQARWHQQFDDVPRPAVPGRPVRAAVRLVESLPAEVRDAMGRALTELSPLMRAVSSLPPEALAAASAGVMPPGFKSMVAQQIEIDRLATQVRMVCPPDRLDEAMAVVDQRTPSMGREQALKSVVDDLAYDRLFTPENAAFPQVASIPDPARGWLSRLFDRLFGRTT